MVIDILDSDKANIQVPKSKKEPILSLPVLLNDGKHYSPTFKLRSDKILDEEYEAWYRRKVEEGKKQIPA